MKTATRADLAKGRAAFKNIITSATTLFDLVDKYGESIWGEVGKGQVDAAKAILPRAVKLQMESLEQMATSFSVSQPVAPSKKACSFYCAPSRGEPRGCIYCGQLKSKHTKAAQDKQKEYAPKGYGRAHV
jgi:hypothetical protein